VVLPLAVLAVLVVLVGLWLVATANRLDRLHVRTDAGWAALDAALARRAVVARAVAAGDTVTEPAARRLRRAAERAESAPWAEREVEENELTRLLAEVDRGMLPRPLADELSDAEHRLVIARRVHNDAVRDTLSLRRCRRVRYFKLAGTAPQPEYFEIAEPELTSGPATAVRRSARVLLVDAEGRVLLFHGHAPNDPAERFWFTTGGGVEQDEDLRAAALREVREETGIDLAGDRLVGPVWRRRAEFRVDGGNAEGDEWFFLARLAGEGGTRDIDTSGFTELEAATIEGHRWWSVEELRDTGETVYPEQAADLLADLLDGSWDGRLRTVH
jgi:8-oxo-dGTP pyrophosphatase MutT (NUDIX family)